MKSFALLLLSLFVVLIPIAQAEPETSDCILMMKGFVDGKAFWYYQCENAAQKCGLLIHQGESPKRSCENK
jgi:hypothetical protein